MVIANFIISINVSEFRYNISLQHSQLFLDPSIQVEILSYRSKKLHSIES
jgi:hypothetical protein